MGTNFIVVDSAGDGHGDDEDAVVDGSQETDRCPEGSLMQDVVEVEKKALKIMTMI